MLLYDSKCNMIKHNFFKEQVSPNTIADQKVDATFRKIAKNAICFHIWRIEEDRLEAEPKSLYGTFHDDCAYIVYAASPRGTYVDQDTVTRETKPGIILERFIHFWLGEKVSEQKRSNVTHKIQELDSYFANVATEYRETQDNESARFLSYFKNGITIVGNAKSKHSPCLYQLRGRQVFRTTQMDSIGWEHFCADYVMILDMPQELFIWFGRSSSKVERRRALEVANSDFLKRNPKKITIVDDGYEQQLPEASKKVWNTVLPLNQRIVQQAAQLIDHNNIKTRIYKCSYRAQRVQLDQLDVAIPSQEDLNDTTAVYLLDYQNQGIWLWVGRQATQLDTVSAMGNGRAFMKKKKYPYTTPLVRVVDGHEPDEFIRLFPNWFCERSDTIAGNCNNGHVKPLPSCALGKFDSMTLCQRPKLAAETQLIDDGNGDRTIYCVYQEHIQQLPVAKATVFSTEHCYVMEYIVTCPSSNANDVQNIGVHTVIYQWIGSNANKTDVEKSSNFARTRFLNNKQNTMYVQMSEFDETPHFLQIFKGNLIILQKDCDAFLLATNNNHNINNNNFKNHNNNHLENGECCEQIPNSKRDFYILRITGNATYNSKAVEVYPVSSLNSKDCYVIKTSHIWVWCGQSSTGDTREIAKSMGALLGECSLILENKEPKEFWRSVMAFMKTPPIAAVRSSSSSDSVCSSTNGSANIMSNHSAKSLERIPSPQLFQAWLQHGHFCCQEVIGYQQRDLFPECIYILDAHIVNYIWLGSNTNNNDSDKYYELLQHYLQIVPIARRPSTAFCLIRQHDEPNSFKGFFEKWSIQFWKDYINYEEKRKLHQPDLVSMHPINGKAKNGDCGSSPVQNFILNHNKEFDSHVKFPISVLQQEAECLPQEINPLKREVHLTHDDFVSLFKMSFWEFDELPGWKQQELKKKHKLF